MNGLENIQILSGMPRGVGHAFAKAEVVFTQAQVAAAIDRLAVAMTVSLQDQNPICLSVMQGGLYLSGQLMQRMVFPLQQGYVDVSRYREATQGGDLRWQGAEHPPLADRIVVLIDDVLDEGHTMAYLQQWAVQAGAKKVFIAVLADKNKSSVSADYSALACPDRFLFGCGMDIHGYGRNLSTLYAVPN